MIFKFDKSRLFIFSSSLLLMLVPTSSFGCSGHGLIILVVFNVTHEKCEEEHHQPHNFEERGIVATLTAGNPQAVMVAAR